MLKLPAQIRARYDLSSHRLTFHAAAPCPVPVKQAMLQWWGPIIHEFYAGTEFNGLTSITPEEWLTHAGSVGRATFGTVHIMSEDGVELPERKEGLIYFEGGSRFAYHNDPHQTAAAYNEKGWSTLGDIGWIDADRYLYLTDRQSFMVISGGVNIYPREIEDLIVTHPKVADVAVIGAPDEDLGERLVAVVQPLAWEDAGPELAQEIQELARANLSRVKVPRQVDFSRELSRQPTGKLYKRLLRDEYWGKTPIAARRPPGDV
jgi:long-chain acyl-CoA synthetase